MNIEATYSERDPGVTVLDFQIKLPSQPTKRGRTLLAEMEDLLEKLRAKRSAAVVTSTPHSDR